MPEAATETAKPAPQWKRFQDKTLTITLSYPKLLFGILFAIVLFVWTFIFGIMIGRGHNPEKVVPKLAEVMPQPASPTPENKPAVLKRQELGYHDTLKGNQSTPRPATKPAPKPAPPKQPTPTPAATPPAQPPKTPAAQAAPATPPKPSQQAQPTVANDETVYEYLYQVAASNNAQASESLKKRLEASGLTVRMAETETNGSKWYRILVVFRGTPDDTRALRDKLARHDIQQVILRGKTPIKR